MAATAFANGHGVTLSALPAFPKGVPATTSFTVDAAGESVAAIGRLYLTTGAGTSKTLSTGKIWYCTGACTFNNGGTTLKIGVQDVGATGLEDTTYDVSVTLTGGSGVTTTAVNSATMNSGTKTIAHGDLIAVVFELTAKGGADSVIVLGANTGSASTFPYTTADTGSGPAKSAAGSVLLISIQFDDGTFGWLGAGGLAAKLETATAFSSSSTLDEHALIFTLPVPATIYDVIFESSSLASTDDFELILYSDPLGTPAVIEAIVFDADLVGATAAAMVVGQFTTPRALTAGTVYALALRPTTTNTLGYSRLNFGASNGDLRKVTTLGTNWNFGTRSNQTGAFSADDTILPLFSMTLGLFDDGTGGGSPGGAHIFGGTVIR